MFRIWKLPVFVVRPWRLAPELDRFDDARCRIFCEKVAWARRAGAAIALGVALFMGLLFMGLWMVGRDGIGELLGRDATNIDTRTGRAFGAVFGVVMMSLTLCVALTPYCALMRWALRRHIERVVCPSCRYSLLGLPLANPRHAPAGVTTGPARITPPISPAEPDTVVCPECGTRIVLGAHGLRAEDIIAGESTEDVCAPGEVAPGRRSAAEAGRASGGMLFVMAVPVPALLLAWIGTGANGWLLGAVLLLLVMAMAFGLRQHWAEWAGEDEEGDTGQPG